MLTGLGISSVGRYLCIKSQSRTPLEALLLEAQGAGLQASLSGKGRDHYYILWICELAIVAAA